MSSGLYSGQPGLSLGTGLYRTVSGLWSGASGLAMAFGGAGMPLSLNFLTMTAYTLDPRITFSRGSQAMVTDATGQLTYAPNNLLANSESFEAASWIKLNGTTTSANSIIAPNDTVTADTIIEAASTNIFGVRRSADLPGGQAVFSVYVKPNGRNWVQLICAAGGSGSAFFNVSTGAVGTTSGATASITAAKNGFYRCTIVFPAAAGANTMDVRLASADGTISYAGDGTSGIYIWGAQLEQVTYQTTPSPYVSTTPKNLLGYTQEFDNAAWVKSNASVTPNAIAAPDGSLTADKLVENTANAQHYVQQAATLAVATHILSFYAKQAERGYVVVINSTGPNQFAVFDLINGAISSTGANATSSISAIGNGWYRCSIAFTAASGANTFRIYPALDANTTVYTGDGTSGIYIWGAQLSNSASVDPYVYNPVAAPSSTAYYGPRFDYDPVTLAPRGLLIEEQRTNLLVYSEDISQTAWAKTNVTVGATSITSPSGGTANSVSATSLGSFLEFYQDATVTAGAVYTYSAFLHPSVSVSGTLRVRDVATVFNRADVDFNLTNKTAVVNVYGTYTNGSVKIIERFDGFFRVEMTFTVGSNTSVKAGLYQASVFSGGIYLWGAQLEAGAFATSYIPTVASQVTRTADVALMQGANFSNWYNLNEGTFVSGFDVVSTATASKAIFAVNDGTSNNLNIVYVSSGAGLFSEIRSSGSTQATLGGNTIIPNVVAVNATAYKANDFAAVLNGGAASTDTLGAVPVGPTAMNIGYSSNYGGLYLNGHIRSIRYYNTRLPNAQLQALTQ